MTSHSEAARSDAIRRLELGEFLKAQRAKLAPGLFGLPAGTRRRTPGLRREEVAQLCGLSTTWYTWLEQGRDISLSAAALGRIAGVLRFTAAERAYLFDLAGRRDPRHGGEGEPEAPAALTAALPQISTPAYILDAYWTALAWNEPARALFSGGLDGENDRSLLRFIFLSDEARRLIVDWEARARRVIAEFRADYSRHLDEPRMEALVAELSAGSSFFRQGWHEHSVLGREGGVRQFADAAGTRSSYRQVTLNPAGRPDLKVVILTPFE
jgi:transcriptional regulator with XRE-family HTH domain